MESHYNEWVVVSIRSCPLARPSPCGDVHGKPPSVYQHPSHVSAVGGRRGVYPTPVLFTVMKRRGAANVALEHLLVGLPEILRQKSVYDGVHRGIAVGQAVGGDSEEEGGGGQWENPKLSPEIDDVVRQPGYPENHDHHQNGLRRLEEEEGDKAHASVTAGEGPRAPDASEKDHFPVLPWSQTRSAFHAGRDFAPRFCSGLVQDLCGKDFVTYVRHAWIAGRVCWVVGLQLCRD